MIGGALAARADFENSHSLAAAGACTPGAIWTGAATGGRFAAACFLAAAGTAPGVVADSGREAGTGAVAALAGGFGEAAPSGGSGPMMLTAGVEAEVGNSALVGLPVGIAGGKAATSPAPACGGALHDGAWRVTRFS